MNLLKNIWLDLAVTAVIAVAVFLDHEVARWAVMIYTPFMVVLKIASFTTRHSPSRIKTKDLGVPVLVYHVLYGANVALLVFGSLNVRDLWWWFAACWAVIWLLSAATGTGKQSPKKVD